MLTYLFRWYIDAPRITLYGKPSADFSKQQTEEETNRLEKQRIGLGENRLEILQWKLDDALATNNAPIPKELLESFKIPPASTIQFINVVTARNNDSSL